MNKPRLRLTTDADRTNADKLAAAYEYFVIYLNQPTVPLQEIVALARDRYGYTGTIDDAQAVSGFEARTK